MYILLLYIINYNFFNYYFYVLPPSSQIFLIRTLVYDQFPAKLMFLSSSALIIVTYLCIQLKAKWKKLESLYKLVNNVSSDFIHWVN